MEAHPVTKPGIDRTQVLKAAASLGVLGTGANSAPRIMAALCNPQLDSKEVAALVGKEPALYARVLRVANSPYYGQSRSITTIDRALVVLGVDAVRGIAAAACLDRSLPRRGEDSLVDMTSVVRHSIATAASAESLARIRRPGLAGEAFIAGLLHNLGIVVQLQLDAPGIRAVIKLREAGDVRDMRTLEAECVAIGHEECIGVIFEAWQLPESLIAAARDHHDPMSAAPPHRELAALINLGANLGLAGGSTFALESAGAARNAPAMAWLELDDAQLDGVAVDMPARVAALRSALLDP
ncbi:MAG TPA: HDOD domain-containing protein [Steroidobacteraceae bacterium]|nr:HDOD domain-containing protein [Steroidobacteraceae bacterium]